MSETLVLPPLSDGSPAGPNLELDAAFGEMERVAQGKPETQYGNTVEPAVPPDWKQTAALATELQERTRDLRVMTLLAIARLHTEGLPAFAAELAVIRWHLETLWEHVHPQLDPEDDNDPMQRANALGLLTIVSRVVRPLRETPLAGTPRTGPVTWRDIAILNGRMEAEPGREKLGEAAIRAAFAGTDQTRLKTQREALESMEASLGAIQAVFDPLPTSGKGLDCADLIKLVRDIHKALAHYEALAAEASAAAEDAAEEDPAVEDETTAEAAPGRPVRTPRGGASIQSIAVLNSREDALHALELAAAYFRVHEPSSPLPLLIDRAKRLASLPFLEILRDMAPDGLHQAQLIAGAADQAEGG
jgi:type VI secretion system protein ImpA